MDGATIANIVTILCSATGTLVIKSIIDGIRLAKSGVSGREDKRNHSLIEQREHALKLARDAEAGERAAEERERSQRTRAQAAETRADHERDQRRLALDQLARVRRVLIEQGGDPGPWPHFDDTEIPGS